MADFPIKRFSNSIQSCFSRARPDASTGSAVNNQLLNLPDQRSLGVVGLKDLSALFFNKFRMSAKKILANIIYFDGHSLCEANRCKKELTTLAIADFMEAKKLPK